MNAILNAPYQSRSAHSLFPPDQAFLWLPGFCGEQSPYCTYNEFRADRLHDNRRFYMLPEVDENGAHYIPPYPVSLETHISWHTQVNPPFPYHPVPINRTLNSDELKELGRNVMILLDINPSPDADPLAVLINDHKPYVLAALAQMDLLPSRSTMLQPYI